MKESISARRLRELIGPLGSQPGVSLYATLADTLTLLIGDGRLRPGLRLPSERELTAALGLSRTTVGRAYTVLRDNGYAQAVQGAGTFTAVPVGRESVQDRVLVPGTADQSWIDMNCAADSAPPDVMAAYALALQELPAYLGGHGYFPTGLPVLQEAIAASYTARGLPTTRDEILVTPGTLTAASVVVHALATRHASALLESPTYPNVAEVFRCSGMRLLATPLDRRGWDEAAIQDSLQQERPGFAYLIPDFQNPTGAVMTAAQRQSLGAAMLASKTVPIIDETHHALALDGQTMPPPFACFHPEAIMLGGMSKTFWGGLRIGWIRAPKTLITRLVRTRMSLDLGVPVLEQLAAAQLLRTGPVAAGQLERLRRQRDALTRAVGTHLPDWRFEPPGGGLVLWCELPDRSATALASAMMQRHTMISPGPLFALQGGLDQFVRLPWTRPVAELEEAVQRIALGWSQIRQQQQQGKRLPRPSGMLPIVGAL